MSHDLFSSLERVLVKYRSNVHQLSGPAPDEAIQALQGHLGLNLPPGLRTFLQRHNGGQLFRGSLSLRSASEMTFAHPDLPRVILFADQNELKWAWAVDEHESYVFGLWDEQILIPYHTGFRGWLNATLSLLDTRVVTPDDQEALRFEADPNDLYQLLRAGERLLKQGDPEGATPFFRKATQNAPSHVGAWQRLGEALLVSHRPAAQKAWLNAFNLSTLPLPWPGAPCLDASLLRTLGGFFSNPEDWEKKLAHFLDERAHDTHHPLVIAAATQLARSRCQRGRRHEARQSLADLVERAKHLPPSHQPWTLVLKVAELERNLGLHDSAEGHLRELHRHAPSAFHGPALLLLARIAIERQEPWAEEILSQAQAQQLSDEDRALASSLRFERAMRQDHSQVMVQSLEALREHVQTANTRRLRATLCLAEGDTLRVQNKAEAAQCYERGLSCVQIQEEPELVCRIYGRLGDVALGQHKYSLAFEHYSAAITGFGEYGFPVRAGWAILRLARISPEKETLLNMARERFTEADLAAGVAAVDSISGDPGQSLEWHLNRARAHAFARYNAQRPKAPYERSDADRPERRLGAHRLAIAACPVSVIQAIGQHLRSYSLNIERSATTRPSDENVLNYVAAVDLVSGHPSFQAAQLLLQNLLDQHTEGVASLALQAAIVRSPNPALVDGLLECIEHPSNYPSHSVAAAIELLGLRRERNALRTLTRLALPKSHPLLRKAAITALGRIGDKRVVSRLSEALSDPAVAEQAAISLLLLGDRRGVDFHGQALQNGTCAPGNSPGEIVGRYGGPDYLPLLLSFAEKDSARALGAIEGLGLLGDPRAIPTLLKLIETRDRNRAEVINLSLQLITGHLEDMEDPGARARWNLMWEEREPHFTPGRRYRAGELFGVKLLLKRLEGDDAWIRRTAYDELVILTGVHLPFDSDGPWRVQVSHLIQWRRWHQVNHRHFSPGVWYHNGEKIG